MTWRDTVLKWRASRLGEALIRASDIDLRWRIPHVTFPVFLQASRNLSEMLNRGGKEAAEREMFRAIASYPEIVEFWDVGANIGQYTWEFISCAGSKRALLFEPDERNARTIRKTIANAALSGCELWTIAVSDRVGELIFKRDTITGKQGTIVSDANIERIMGRCASSIAVPSSTIDAICHATGGFPNLLKIDVEGAEKAVISGAVRTLQEHRPIVFIEILPENFSPIHEVLAATGYSLLNAATRGPADAQSFNVLAIDRDRYPAIYRDLFSKT